MKKEAPSLNLEPLSMTYETINKDSELKADDQIIDLNSVVVAEEKPADIFITGQTLVNMQIESIPMLFDGLFPKVGICSIVGASDTCKSMLLRQLAMCNASGKDFLGHRCNNEYKRSIVVCSEDDELAIAYLLRKQNASLQLTEEELNNLVFLFDTDDFIEKLHAELQNKPADLVVIDAFGDLFNGKDLNQNNQVRQFLNNFSNMANKYKCAIVFLHHTGKRTEDQAPSKNNSIGSQGFEAKMRLLMELRLDKNNEDLRHLCIVKGNYLPQSEKQSSHVIKMSENLTFEATGERVSYDQLLNNGKDASNKRIEPSDITNETHELTLYKIFKSKKELSQRDLTEKLTHSYSISDKPARRFVDFYLDNGYIKNVSKSKRLYRYSLILKTKDDDV